jgi:outer membrane receptor protein involved in Fe transport
VTIVLRKGSSRCVARRRGVAAFAILLGWPIAIPEAQAQTPNQQELPPIVVTAPRPARQAPKRTTARPAPAPATTVAAPQTASEPASGAAPSAAASEITLSRERVTAQPALRPGEVLEATPGLIITQHSGEGKANQYFLRGFNLDHGTDLAITVDGMPVNMRTHGHGQGYADVNFLIPELVQSMRVRKGPYFAEEGDFASAGALRIDYINTMNPGLWQGTLGMYGYGRALAIKSYPISAGTPWTGNSTVTNPLAGNLLVAAEATAYDGPWDVPDRMKKLNGVVRYSSGTADEGVSITGMAYKNSWTSTDQIARRAVDQGLISRWGTLDPTDGGNSSRYSLSARMSGINELGRTQLEAYAIRSTLTLYNNFTYFLDDPSDGDQFSQGDKRTILGFHGNHTFKGRLGAFDSETKVGIQGRFDDIDVALTKTVERVTRPDGDIRRDKVREDSIGLYAENTTRLTDWLRTIVGVRHDQFWANVTSDTPANSGNADAAITSPKVGLVLGPFRNNEIFLNAGYGFHSNDVRGVTITVNPHNAPDADLPADKVPFLVRAKGAEVGWRARPVAGLETSVALFVLDYASELLFVGDAGTTEASRPSRRTGVEWTTTYNPVSWLGFELDIAATRARFTDFDPAGNRVPGAPNVVSSLGVTFGEQLGWFGAVKMRYFGPRPLIEDNSSRTSSTALVNARLGYRFDNGIHVQLDAFNLFNAKADQITYFYESRLQSDPLGVSVNDQHFHPVEPLSLRLSVAGRF